MRAVADDRQVDLDVLVDRGRIDVDMDLVEPGENASSRPVMRSSKRAPMQIIRSQSCIAPVRLPGPVHAEHAEPLRIGGRIGAEPHQRRGDGKARPLEPVRAAARWRSARS